MTDEHITLTRRRLIGSLTALGTASAGAGAGSYALFSDSERAEATFNAGTLNLTVDGESGPLVFLDEDALQPGASGSVELPLRNAGGTTGYLDIDVVSATDEEGVVHEVGDGSDRGELGENLTVTAKLTDGTDGESVLCSPDTAFASLFVDNVGKRFSPNYELASGDTATFVLEWAVDADAGSAIAGDAASVALEFVLNQNPTDDGTASCSSDDGSDGSDSLATAENELGLGTTDWTTVARYGGTDEYEVGILKDGGRVHKNSGGRTWTSGETVPFTVAFDGSKVSFTIDGTTYPTNSGKQGVGSGLSRLAVTAIERGDGTSVSITDLSVTPTDGNGNGKGGGGTGTERSLRDLSVEDDGHNAAYVDVVDGDGDGEVPLEDGFDLTGKVTFTWGNGTPAPDDLVFRVDAWKGD
jgi:predicted ribosomally synthesized peptide with SipW-like signal peptide